MEKVKSDYLRGSWVVSHNGLVYEITRGVKNGKIFYKVFCGGKFLLWRRQCSSAYNAIKAIGEGVCNV